MNTFSSLDHLLRRISAWCTVKQCTELWANSLCTELGNLGAMSTGAALVISALGYIMLSRQYKIKIGTLGHTLLKFYTYICNRHRNHWHILRQQFLLMQHTLLLSSILRSYHQYHQFLDRYHSGRKGKCQKISEKNCFHMRA